MKVNFFKLNKSRRFNYTPRYYKGKEEASVFHSEGRLVIIGKHIMKMIGENCGRIREIGLGIEKTKN